MIKIEVKADKITARLSELSGTLNDLTPVMRQIGGVMLAAVEQNFDTEGARIGKRWKPSLRAKRDGGKTLQDTGRLAGSFVIKADRTSAIVGTNVVYAAIHQFGGKTGRGHKLILPARPFLGLNSQDKNDIVKKIVSAIQRPYR